jgi:hypothetical protein
MGSSKARTAHRPETGRFVLTRSTGEKISAVEGLKLTGRMRRILDQQVSGDERRSLIMETLRRK